SRKLKRLSITWYCYSKLQREGFIEVVQKLPSLEELSLIDTTITAKAFEALERSWSWFKSLELKKISCITKSGEEINKEALAIAQSLPALRRLQLIRNYMTNEGLQAILDGCPNLVSLDLRGCFNVRLDKVSSSRISRQIKDVKLPHDTMEDTCGKLLAWQGITRRIYGWAEKIEWATKHVTGKGPKAVIYRMSIAGA
ncbi:PREDICTED: putative F-box/LRR-repeat protein 23, partial [Nicotiana attenuata]|uniref:putative F-box/LRR-repeat protein 23 n=1 Tax=Nicotiana attenuata TaxID=49451 RepID=UPI0009053AF3